MFEKLELFHCLPSHRDTYEIQFLTVGYEQNNVNSK